MPFLMRKTLAMNGININTLLDQIALVHNNAFFMTTSLADVSPNIDLSIDGMRSQQFSVGVFIFMLIGVFVFGSIIYVIAFGKGGAKSLKTGEKAMVVAIILGTLVAVAMGAVQLLTGYLF
jgi:cation transport ATPase